MKPAEAQNSRPQTMELKRINLKEEICNFVVESINSGGDFIDKQSSFLHSRLVVSFFHQAAENAVMIVAIGPNLSFLITDLVCFGLFLFGQLFSFLNRIIEFTRLLDSRSELVFL